MELSEPNSPNLDPKPIAALPPSFYLLPTAEVAKALLGKGLYLKHRNKEYLVEIHEVEAYLGEDDPACHAASGVTKRNRPMFEQGGICYVYLSYGINYCMNVVTEREGVGAAVLLRAAVPLLGIDAMAKNRKISLPPHPKQKDLKKILSGPGKMTQALCVDLKQNGLALDNDSFKILDLGTQYGKNEIEASPRIGISKAKEKLLRFTVKGSPWLSRQR